MLKARALSDSHRFCAIAIHIMIAYLVITFAQTESLGPKSSFIRRDTLVVVMLVTHLK